MSLFKKEIIPNNSTNKSNLTDIFLITAVFILTAALLLVNSVNRDKNKSQIITLTLSYEFGELFGTELTWNLIDDFNEQNPGIFIRTQASLHAEGAETNPLTAEAVKPDIYIFDDNDLIKIENILINLPRLKDANLQDEYPDDSQPYSDTEPAQQQWNVPYQQDAPLNEEPNLKIPLVTFMDVLFYNIDILSAAGFDRPPRTRGEYNTYSRTAEEKGFYSDSISVPETSNPLNIKLEDFVQGKAAMIIASTRVIPYLREKMGDDIFGITAIPVSIDGSSGKYDINLTGIYAGIGESCENPDAAWSFILFLAEKRDFFCDLFKAVPGTSSDIIPGNYVKDDLFYSKAWDIYEYNRE